MSTFNEDECRAEEAFESARREWHDNEDAGDCSMMGAADASEYRDNEQDAATAHAPYAWIITADRINTAKEVGTIGPRDASEANMIALRQNAGEKFKMYDDDGELYYSGRIVGDYDGFEPLDDFGTPNAGCARIYYQVDGEWRML